MNKTKFELLERIVQAILMTILISLIFNIMFDVRMLQGNARVVNYAGIVRGATQRLVKLEIAAEPNDALIHYLDEILLGLQNGGGEYELSRLNHEEFQVTLSQMQQM